MNMKRILLSLSFLLVTITFLSAQEDEAEKKGFKKENLFTGGGISLGLGFSNYGNTFSIGASPILGYSFTNWLDAGIVVNYNYTSYKDYPYDGYRTKVHQYGGGLFTRVYPVKFIFIQAQFEHNFTTWREKYAGASYTNKYDGNSILVGAGYATSRDPLNKMPFFYIAVMADVSGNKYSPYVDTRGNAVPLIVTGFQFPLFQGKRDNYDNTEEGGSRKPRNYNRY
jgi:hypothetical protein